MAITKTDWDNLSEKAQWDIKVALRGPDVYHAETIKWFTTSVIRGRCRKVFRVGGLVNSDLKMVILPSGYRNSQTKRDNPDAWNSGHFLDHVSTAAQWLHVPVLHVPADVWFDAMRSDIRDAGEQILKAAEQQMQENHKLLVPQQMECIAELKRHLKSGCV